MTVLTAATFFAFGVFTSPVKAAGENYCEDSVRRADHSQIDLITKSLTSRITKGDSFVVLIENFSNDYGITYIVDILKQGNSVAEQTGSLEAVSGIGNIGKPEFETSNLDPADYVVKIKLYHKDLHCLLSMETKPIEIILTNDITTPSGVALFSKNDIIISAVNKQIDAGGHVQISMENKTSADLLFEIKVNDLKTGNYLSKATGFLNKGEKTSAWVDIMTPGNHTIKVDIVDSNSADYLLYTQNFDIVVADPNGTAPASEPGAGSGGSLKNSQPTTNSDGDDITPTLGKIFKAIFPGGDAAKADLNSIGSLVVKVTDYALSFAGIVAFVMVLWAARALLNSYGSEESFVMAKKTLIWALVGLLVILVSKGLLNWIVCFFTTEGVCK